MLGHFSDMSDHVLPMSDSKISLELLLMQDAALASLKSLNKNDVVEVRALQRPPPGVRMVIEAVSIMKEVKPKKVAGEKIGTKVDDYWEPGKALLQDPTKFLESLFKYDKVCAYVTVLIIVVYSFYTVCMFVLCMCMHIL